MKTTEHPEWFILDSSKIQDFMSCPRYVFYRHVLGWCSEHPNNHLIFGSAWHEAMEHLLLHGYEQQSVLDAYDKFNTYYRSTFSPETDDLYMPKTPATAFVMLASYVDKWKKDPQEFDTIYTEIGGTVSIGLNKELYYRMDSVLKRRSDGFYGSREHKTASSLWNWTEQWLLSFQVGTYNHVLYCMYEPKTIYGVEMNAAVFSKSKKGWDQILSTQSLTVKDPRDFMRCTILKNPGQMQNWLVQANWWYDSYMQELEVLLDTDSPDSDIMYAFPLNTRSCLNYGRLCEYHDFCLAWSNPLQKCNEPPIGFKVKFWNPMEEAPKHTFNI